jgi:prepilin-type N-terminal cleavage/methylation domain-containing protein
MKAADLLYKRSELIKADEQGSELNSRNKKGFTLVEIMIVITIISILLGIAIPSFLNSREKTKSRSCTENLHQINTAKEQLAMAAGLGEGATISQLQIMPYLHENGFPSCPAGGTYDVQPVGVTPTCSVQGGKYPHVFAP